MTCATNSSKLVYLSNESIQEHILNIFIQRLKQIQEFIASILSESAINHVPNDGNLFIFTKQNVAGRRSESKDAVSIAYHS